MWRFLIVLIPGIAMAEVAQGPPNATFEPQFSDQTRAQELPASDVDVSVFASGFDFPWGIAALPDGGFLVTERGGVLWEIDPSGASRTAINGVPAVDAVGQGGLLDVAVSQTFERDRSVYLTYSKSVDGARVLAALRGVLRDGALQDVEDIFVQSPGVAGSKHFGSRIIPGDGGVWITTGDRGTPDLVQGDTTVGKVIWVGDNGPEVWSRGHRNIQGAILHNGDLWAVEHGPRGGDELNRVEQGLNYGWPVVSYGIDYSGADVGEGIAVADGLEPPVYYWDPVIAPGGMGAYPDNGAFGPWRGNLFVSSLRPGGVMRLQVEQGRIVGEERLLPEVGRIRDVEVLANGDLLVLQDAPDAEILRVSPVGGATD